MGGMGAIANHRFVQAKYSTYCWKSNEWKLSLGVGAIVIRHSSFPIPPYPLFFCFADEAVRQLDVAQAIA